MTDRLFVGTRKGLLTFEPGAGASWKLRDLAFEGAPVTAVLRDPRDGGILAALNHGHFGVKLHRSDDDGQTWRELPVPAYPERPADLEISESLPGSKAPWNTEQLWILETDGVSDSRGLWAGTIPGGLFHSSDGGESWELVSSLWNHPDRLKWFGGGYDLAGIHSICVDPENADHVRVGVSCGGIWETLDRGESWKVIGSGLVAEYMPPEQQGDLSIQDPHRLVQCSTSPDHLWIQHHNGIFRSTDRGRSWAAIEASEPSAFGFCVAVHPREPDTAWFVPARKDECRVPVDREFVVTRTRDGGKTLETLREGLPAAPAFDIVYRHALDIDVTGDRLALGSTTGGLWVSPDQGDRFELVSAHLPPVYCLRFGG